jgi:hypothetical protein
MHGETVKSYTIDVKRVYIRCYTPVILMIEQGSIKFVYIM